MFSVKNNSTVENAKLAASGFVLSFIFLGLHEASIVVEFLIDALWVADAPDLAFFRSEFWAGLKLLSMQFAFWFLLVVAGFAISSFCYELVSRILVDSWLFSMVLVTANKYSELASGGQWTGHSSILLIETLIYAQGFFGFVAAFHSIRGGRSSSLEQHLLFAICLFSSLWVFGWFRIVNYWVVVASVAFWLLAIPVVWVLGSMVRTKLRVGRANQTGQVHQENSP